MKRRNFFASLAALVVTPAIAIGLKTTTQPKNKKRINPDKYRRLPSGAATIKSVEDGRETVHITLTDADIFDGRVYAVAGDLVIFEDGTIGFVARVGFDNQISIKPIHANVLLGPKCVPGTCIVFYTGYYPESTTIQ